MGARLRRLAVQGAGRGMEDWGGESVAVYGNGTDAGVAQLEFRPDKKINFETTPEYEEKHSKKRPHADGRFSASSVETHPL